MGDDRNLAESGQPTAAAPTQAPELAGRHRPLTPGLDNGTLPHVGRRSSPSRLAIAFAAAAAVLVIGGVGFLAWPQAPQRPAAPSEAAPTLPGGPGHFDDGTFSFDYPNDWTVASGDFLESPATEVFAVLGTGKWRSGCTYSANGGLCTGDVVDVGGGRFVVKLWARVGGPVAMCSDIPASATFGPNAVLESSEGGAVIWEVRRPGSQFGVEMNVFVQVWADGPAAVRRAQDLVAGFRWDAGVGQGSMCLPAESSAAPAG